MDHGGIHLYRNGYLLLDLEEKIKGREAPLFLIDSDLVAVILHYDGVR